MNVLHSISFACGGVALSTFCLRIKAMSPLKSRHNTCV